MTPVEPGLPEATQAIVATLERLGVPYAIGGAVAMSFSGYLRGTRDVDVLALVPAIRTQELADALEAAGFRMRDANDRLIPVEATLIIRATRELGQFRIWFDDVKVEVFFPRVALQHSLLERRVRVQVDDLAMWVTTAEDLILLKMIFHRPKDLEDVRRLIAANRETLDLAYLQDWSGRTLEPNVADELLEMLRRSNV